MISVLGAQKASAQFRYGPAAGVEFTTLKFNQKLFTIDQSTGVTAGIMAEMMFPGVGFGIDLGLLYEQRGARLHLGEKELWSSQGYDAPRSTLHYMNIPLHLRFKWTRMSGLEDYVAPFVSAGPSVGFLVGHNKVEALEYAGGELGIDLGGGLEICRNFQISASYRWGMTYALKTKILTDYSAKNRSWVIRAAWLF